jgi:serine/arginine repetitive matrix protein 2
MYNGLGLRTARGSGTNGYVQRNLSFAKPKPQANFSYDQPAPKLARTPNADILLHRSKRQIEVDCLQYEEELLDSKEEYKRHAHLVNNHCRYTKEEIKEKVAAFRIKQLARLDDKLKHNSKECLKEQKEKEMERLKGAFGISDKAVVGDAFKFESDKQRQERLAQYAEEDRLERSRKRLRDR